jgi:hypothetical protein
MHHARYVVSDSGEAAQGSVCIFTILDDWTSYLLTQSVLVRGLTAYNHNLDTSREHYPKVDIPEYT